MSLAAPKLGKLLETTILSPELVVRVVKDGTKEAIMLLLGHEKMTKDLFAAAVLPSKYDYEEENILNFFMSRCMQRELPPQDQVEILTAIVNHKFMTSEIFNHPSRVFGNHQDPYPALLAAAEYSLWHLFPLLVGPSFPGRRACQHKFY